MGDEESIFQFFYKKAFQYKQTKKKNPQTPGSTKSWILNSFWQILNSFWLYFVTLICVIVSKNILKLFLTDSWEFLSIGKKIKL